MKKERFFVLAILLAALLCLLSSCGKAGTSFEVTYKDATYTVDPAAQTISNGDRTFRYFQMDSGIGIVYPDQTVYLRGQDLLSDSLIAVLEEVENRAFPQQKHLNLIALPVIALGLLAALFPKKSWYWRYGWRYQNAEPSGMGLKWERVVGVLISLLGLWALFLPQA